MRVFVVLVALANLCASQPTDQSGLRGNVLEPGVSSFVSDSGMGSVPDAGMLQPGATDPAMDTFSDTGAFSDVVMGQPGASDFGMGAFPEAGMGQPDATGPGMGAFPDAGTGQPGVTDPFMDAFPDAGAFPDTGMGQPGASDFGMGAFSDSGNVQSGATDPGAGLVSESGMAATGTAGAGGEVPGKRQAGAAADLLRGLMGETSCKYYIDNTSILNCILCFIMCIVLYKFAFVCTQCHLSRNTVFPSRLHVRPAKSQSRIFAARQKKLWILGYQQSVLQRLTSDCADAQIELSLRWTHIQSVVRSMSR